MQNSQFLLPLALILLCTGNNGWGGNTCGCQPCTPTPWPPPYFNNLCQLLLCLCGNGGGPWAGNWGWGGGWNNGWGGAGCGTGWGPGWGSGCGCYYRPHRGCGWGWGGGWW